MSPSRRKGPLARPKRWSIAALGTIALFLTGCASDAPQAPPTHEPGSVYELEPLMNDPNVIVTFTLAGSFASVEQLAAESSAIIVATPTSQRIVDAESFPRMVTTFRVSDVLHGEVKRGDIEVLHFGPFGPNQDTQEPNFPSVPKLHLEYVLALEPVDPRGDGFGDYLLVGPGQWVRQYPDQRFALDLHEYGLLGYGHSIPTDTTVDELTLLVRER